MFAAVDNGGLPGCGHQTQGVGAVDFFLPGETGQRPAGVVGIGRPVHDAIEDNPIVVGKNNHESRSCNLAVEVFHFHFCQPAHQAVFLPAFVQVGIADLNLLGTAERIKTVIETALPGSSDFRIENFGWNDSLAGQQGACIFHHRCFLRVTELPSSYGCRGSRRGKARGIFMQSGPAMSALLHGCRPKRFGFKKMNGIYFS